MMSYEIILYALLRFYMEITVQVVMLQVVQAMRGFRYLPMMIGYMADH